jgi:hypothetical protein
MTDPMSHPSAGARFRWLPEPADDWRNLSLYARRTGCRPCANAFVSAVILVSPVDLIVAIASNLLLSGLPAFDQPCFKASSA